MVTIARPLPRSPHPRDYLKRLTAQASALGHRILSALYRIDGAYRASLSLREMDDRTLADVGLTRQQAMVEADKLLWRV